MTIGGKLRILRGTLTQAEAAKRIGMKQQSWRVYESDGSAPGAELITRICEAFDVTSDWLLGMEKKGSVTAHNSSVVIGSGTAINGNAHARGPGKEDICRKCPIKKRLKKIAAMADETADDPA